jgi:hypothetical protein
MATAQVAALRWLAVFAEGGIGIGAAAGILAVHLAPPRPA